MSRSEGSRERPPKRSASALSGPITVLVVDNEEKILLEVRELLEPFRMTVVTARGTAEAFQALSTTKPDLALIDWRLGGHEDGIALGRILRRDHGIPFIVFSGFLNADVTGAAYRLGAVDVIYKPLRAGRLLAAIKLAVQRHPPLPVAQLDDSTESGSDSVSQRWAEMAKRALRSAKDPKTEALAARAAGVSTSVYRKICRASGVAGLDTRDLIRFLRALARAREDGSTLGTHLSAYDPRTQNRLSERAGLPLDTRFVPLRTFILNQKFVSHSKPCLRELAHALANDPLFLVEPDDDRTGTEGA